MTALEAAPAQLSRRGLVLGGILGAAGIAAFVGSRALNLVAPEAPPLNQIVPQRLGAWRSVGTEGLVLPAEAPQSRAYDQELKRIYGGRGARPMMLVVAYSGRPRQGLLQLHDPRVCYPGAGFSVDQAGRSELSLPSSPSLPVQFFTARRRARVEQVVYWTRIGEEIMGPTDDQHLAIVQAVLRGEVPNGVLVRISTFGAGAAALADISSFAGELLASAPAQGREALIGRRLATAWGAAAAERYV